MIAGVHPTAVVDDGAILGPETIVGPYAVVGPGVTIGESAEIGAHAIIERDTTIGRGCAIGYGSVIGSAPQDVRDTGDGTRVVIGDDTVLREYTTINRGSAATGETRVGSRCFLMSYVHVAHDCTIGDDVIVANAVQLAGHVAVGHHAWLGGLTPVHQFVRIGEYAFVGGGSRVPQDIPPFARAVGTPMRLFGINVVGLRRAGWPAHVRLAVQRAFRLLFNSDLPRTEALERLRADPAQPDPVGRLVEFVAGSTRGVLVR